MLADVSPALSLGIWAALLIAVWYSSWAIFRKAGYSGWQALLLVLPLANVIWLIVFASSEWPIERDLAIARLGLGQATPREQELALNTAIRLERRGKAARAQDIYLLLINHATQPELITYARNASAALTRS